MDERGRILIPSEDRRRLRLKPGTEFELTMEKGRLGQRSLLDAGEATFNI